MLGSVSWKTAPKPSFAGRTKLLLGVRRQAEADLEADGGRIGRGRVRGAGRASAPGRFRRVLGHRKLATVNDAILPFCRAAGGPQSGMQRKPHRSGERLSFRTNEADLTKRGIGLLI
jgi:hypothetical protein